MNNILVTGGAGFIGSNFVHYLLRAESGVNIVNLDALTYSGSLENLADLPDPDRHHFVQGDITNVNLVGDLLEQFNIDTLVHFAAESHVDRSIAGASEFVRTNVLGTFTLLETVRHYRQKNPGGFLRFHHISTDEVYGSLEPDDPPFTEETPYAPNSPYAASKASSDHLVRAFEHTYGLPCSITNCSNNYGPRQFPEKLISLVISKALAGDPLPVYGDGRQVRDWLYVEDHCQAIHLVLRSGQSGSTYNIGGENQPTNLEIIRQVCLILDEMFPASPHTPHDSLIRFVADRPGHDRRYAMDISKIERELGWRPTHSLSQALRLTVEWYLSHPSWFSNIQSRQDYRQWMASNYRNRGEGGK